MVFLILFLRIVERSVAHRFEYVFPKNFKKLSNLNIRQIFHIDKILKVIKKKGIRCNENIFGIFFSSRMR